MHFGVPWRDIWFSYPCYISSGRRCIKKLDTFRRHLDQVWDELHMSLAKAGFMVCHLPPMMHPSCITYGHSWGRTLILSSDTAKTCVFVKVFMCLQNLSIWRGIPSRERLEENAGFPVGQHSATVGRHVLSTFSRCSIGTSAEMSQLGMFHLPPVPCILLLRCSVPVSNIWKDDMYTKRYWQFVLYNVQQP